MTEKRKKKSQFMKKRNCTKIYKFSSQYNLLWKKKKKAQKRKKKFSLSLSFFFYTSSDCDRQILEKRPSQSKVVCLHIARKRPNLNSVYR